MAVLMFASIASLTVRQLAYTKDGHGWFTYATYMVLIIGTFLIMTLSDLIGMRGNRKHLNISAFSTVAFVVNFGRNYMKVFIDCGRDQNELTLAEAFVDAVGYSADKIEDKTNNNKTIIQWINQRIKQMIVFLTLSSEVSLSQSITFKNYFTLF